MNHSYQQILETFLKERGCEAGQRLSDDDEQKLADYFKILIEEASRTWWRLLEIAKVIYHYFEHHVGLGAEWSLYDSLILEIYYHFIMEDSEVYREETVRPNCKKFHKFMAYDGTSRLYIKFIEDYLQSTLYVQFLVDVVRTTGLDTDKAFFECISDETKHIRTIIIGDEVKNSYWFHLYDELLANCFILFGIPFDWAIERDDYIPILDMNGLLRRLFLNVYITLATQNVRDISPLLTKMSPESLFSRPESIIPYCKHVLKGRWFDMEPILKEISPEVYSRYIKKVEAGEI